MRRTFAVMMVGLGVTACGSSSGSSPSPGGGGAQTYGVQLDGKADTFNGAFTAFFPNELTVHPGDQIDFQLPHFTGEPHTVALGKLVDDAAAKLNQLGPHATIAAQENSPEMLKLPDPFPHKLPSGPPDANQSAGQPCFLDSGIPPLSLTGGAPACPRRDQPEFNGSQSFYDSGVLQTDGDRYSVKLASSTPAGTYHAICLIHRAAMTATITVAPAGRPAQSPDQVASAGQQQFQKLVSVLQPVADGSAHATADKALAGAADPMTFNALVAQFGPKDISLPVGGTVSWNVFSFHTISFNAQESDVGAFVKAADGSIHLNPRSGAPFNFAVPPAAFEFPPPDDATPLTIDGGKFDGTGFKSTGIIGSLPPRFLTIRVTFTRPGTFPYRCLVHPDMKGTVKVT